MIRDIGDPEALFASMLRIPGAESFEAYIRLRAKGLRKLALRHLDDFLATAATATFPQRQEFVAWLFDTVPDLIVFPLNPKLIEPTLAEWTDREPGDSRPYRWRGLYPARLRSAADAGEARANLWRAIALNPDEQVARFALIRKTMSSVDLSTHELPEHGYLGDPESDLASLDEAEQLAARIKGDEIRGKVLRNVNGYRAMISAWREFRVSDADDFGSWCRERGIVIWRGWM